jgi:hypothetical protein
MVQLWEAERPILRHRARRRCHLFRVRAGLQYRCSYWGNVPAVTFSICKIKLGQSSIILTVPPMLEGNRHASTYVLLPSPYFGPP